MLTPEDNKRAEEFAKNVSSKDGIPNIVDVTDDGITKLWFARVNGEYVVYSEWSESADRTDEKTLRYLGFVSAAEIANDNLKLAYSQLLSAANWPVIPEKMDRTDFERRLKRIIGDVHEQKPEKAPKPERSTPWVKYPEPEESPFSRNFNERMSKLSSIPADKLDSLGLWRIGSLPFADVDGSEVYILGREDWRGVFPVFRYRKGPGKWHFGKVETYAMAGMYGMDDDYKALILSGLCEWGMIEEDEIPVLLGLADPRRSL